MTNDPNTHQSAEPPADVAGLVERIHFHLCKLTVPDDVFDLLTIEELQQISATLTAQARRNAELERALNAQHTCCDCNKTFSGAGQGAYICNDCAGAD